MRHRQLRSLHLPSCTCPVSARHRYFGCSASCQAQAEEHACRDDTDTGQISPALRKTDYEHQEDARLLLPPPGEGSPRSILSVLIILSGIPMLFPVYGTCHRRICNLFGRSSSGFLLKSRHIVPQDAAPLLVLSWLKSGRPSFLDVGLLRVNRFFRLSSNFLFICKQVLIAYTGSFWPYPHSLEIVRRSDSCTRADIDSLFSRQIRVRIFLLNM